METLDVGFSEGEMSEFPECMIQVWPKARKAHICCECSQVINVGEVYRKTSGIWDGDPETFKQCAACAKIFDDEAKKHGYDNVSFGFLFDDENQSEIEQIKSYYRTIDIP